MFWLFGFLRMGTIALTAQAYGAGQAGERSAVLARALMTSAAIGLALLALQVPMAALIFGSMGGSAPVRDAAEHYFFIRLWSAPFALGNYVMLGWLVGLARPMLALSIQVVVNVTSMALTVMLVLVFDWGIAGAAWAAVIAETIGITMGLIIAWRVLGGPFRVRPGRAVRPRQTDTNAGDQPRHHDPHSGADRGLSCSSPRRARAPATSRSPPTQY